MSAILINGAPLTARVIRINNSSAHFCSADKFPSLFSHPPRQPQDHSLLIKTNGHYFLSIVHGENLLAKWGMLINKSDRDTVHVKLFVAAATLGPRLVVSRMQTYCGLSLSRAAENIIYTRSVVLLSATWGQSLAHDSIASRFVYIRSISISCSIWDIIYTVQQRCSLHCGWAGNMLLESWMHDNYGKLNRRTHL